MLLSFIFIKDKLNIGFGLNTWNGISRYSNNKLLEFKKYSNLKDFIKTLPSDAQFIEMHPEVTNKRYYPKKRYEEEMQNVEISECWIYFTKIEDDNDFHIIIGSTQNSSTAKFFNIEVSGLPTKGSDIEQIRETRDYFISNFPVLESYNKKPLMKKVKIKGSIMFDGDHTAGQIGTQYAKPKTVWEIHPVYSIEILD